MGMVKSAVVFGTGYVLGTRAGRGRYEQLQQKASELMQRPEVQRAQDKVESTVHGGERGAESGKGESTRRRWRRGGRQDTPLVERSALPEDDAGSMTATGADTSIDLTPGTESTTTDRRP